MAQPRRRTDHEQNEQRQRRETEYRQATDFTSVYSNNINVRLLPWDIQLTFGNILSVDERKMVVENRLLVYLSPQTAKSLLKVLTGIVKQYEDRIGEIKYGEDKVEQEPK